MPAKVMHELTLKDLYGLILKGSASKGWMGFANDVVALYKEKNGL